MIPAIIVILSSITHFFKFGLPTSVVFDEVYYGNFLTYYWEGSYFFDQHPPFFKLFISFIGRLIGLDHYSANWDSIGNALPDQLVWIRLIPLLAGILLPIIIYAICRRFDLSKSASTLVSLLIVLENSLLVQSRFILPDIFLLTTGFASILFYLEHNRRNGRSKSWFLILSMIFTSITLSTKWTGLTFLFLIIVMESYKIFSHSLQTNGNKPFVPSSLGRYKWMAFTLSSLAEIKPFLKKISIFSLKYLIIASLIYLSLFIIHFNALPHSGKGDPFMTQRFQETLIGNENYGKNANKEMGFWSKFFELNKVMYTANSTMTATHSYSSKWYTWPIMQRPIFYWQQDVEQSAPQKHSFIYLIGNPIVYWLGTLAIVSTILYSLYQFLFKKTLFKKVSDSEFLVFLSIGYLVNLLPFMLIGRVMFIYHYETALVFSIIAIGYLASKIPEKHRTVLIAIIITITSIAFLYWSPLTYGTPIADGQIEERMWMKTWR